MKDIQKEKNKKKAKRARRTRAKIKVNAKRLRLSIFRSHKHIYAQIIDDDKGVTLASVSDHEIKEKGAKKNLAQAVGKLLAAKCQKLKIDKVVFDKGSYKYHGRVSALAEGAREGGLIF